MSAGLVVVLTPDGAGHALYDERIDLSTLGPLHIERATTVEFDERAQCWRVRDREGFAMFNSPSRQACLEWERKYFSNPERLMEHAVSGRGHQPTKGGLNADGSAEDRSPALCRTA